MGFDYTGFAANRLQALKDAGNYRRFINVQRQVGQYPTAIHRPCHFAELPITMWCSNDYLGMGHHPDVISAMCTAVKSYGAGAGGTRNISGHSQAHVTLEKTLAALHDKESALVFTSGYVANQTALTTLGQLFPNAVILSDAKNHASMIQGIRHAGCEKHVFRHNDVAHLQEILQTIDPARPKIIAFESLYSMEGDLGDIAAICDLADRYGALTYLDEVHAVGLYGDTGAGVASAQNLAHRIDFINGTLGKAFGVVGGYIAGNKELIDAVRSFGSGFIFTTSLPPAVCVAATKSIEILQSDEGMRLRIAQQNRVAAVKNALDDANIAYMPNHTHIVPVMIGDAKKCRAIADMLLYSHLIYVQPINAPTVPKGTERLRITPSPYHTDADIAHLIKSLQHVLAVHTPHDVTLAVQRISVNG